MSPKRPYFDRLLYELLEQSNLRQFTALQLKEAYVGQLSGAEINLNDLRKYIYGHIRKLESVGCLIKDNDRRTRGQIYHLKSLPDRGGLTLINHKFLNNLGGDNLEKAGTESPRRQNSKFELERTEEASILEERLEALLKEMRLDFLSAMGEAERFKRIIEDMPLLKNIVEEAYVESRDRSSRLLGHLRAIEKTITLVRPL